MHRVLANLRSFFDDHRQVTSVTEAEAVLFRNYLLTEAHHNGGGLSRSTDAYIEQSRFLLNNAINFGDTQQRRDRARQVLGILDEALEPTNEKSMDELLNELKGIRQDLNQAVQTTANHIRTSNAAAQPGRHQEER